MSAQMTYTSLVASIEAYLDRSDAELIANIPQFIKNAEVRVARELRILAFITAATDTFTPSQAIVAKPANWRETVSINVGTGTGNNTRNPVLPRTYDYLRSYWPDPTVTGVPKYYADYDLNHWLVAPTPTAAYPFEVVYYQLLQGLDAAHQTNVLTDYAPDMLLYACLLESAPYLKDDARIATWQARYDRCLQAEVLDDVRNLIDRQINATENRP
jgi:hypothetical protein